MKEINQEQLLKLSNVEKKEMRNNENKRNNKQQCRILYC